MAKKKPTAKKIKKSVGDLQEKKRKDGQQRRQERRENKDEKIYLKNRNRF